jgi:hypothetical protein
VYHDLVTPQLNHPIEEAEEQQATPASRSDCKELTRRNTIHGPSLHEPVLVHSGVSGSSVLSVVSVLPLVLVLVLVASTTVTGT